MSTRYKVVGKAEKRKPKELLGVYDIPDEALWLNQDIQTLEIMLMLLDRLQERSFVATNSPDYAGSKNEAAKTLRRVAFILEALKRVAEQNLMYDFMDGQKMKPRRPRQTIADVWRIMLDGFKPVGT